MRQRTHLQTPKRNSLRWNARRHRIAVANLAINSSHEYFIPHIWKYDVWSSFCWNENLWFTIQEWFLCVLWMSECVSHACVVHVVGTTNQTATQTWDSFNWHKHTRMWYVVVADKRIDSFSLAKPRCAKCVYVLSSDVRQEREDLKRI